MSRPTDAEMLRRYREFLRLFCKMRESQRGYFRDRTPEALRFSKDYERRADASAAALERLEREESTPSLFGPEALE